jgi:hypothetical protein
MRSRRDAARLLVGEQRCTVAKIGSSRAFLWPFTMPNAIGRPSMDARTSEFASS